jgi:hypothetical protein
MTPEQQQIAIATACGWTGTEEDYTFYGFTREIPMTRTRWTNPSSGKTTLTLPDDLNAMHEAIITKFVTIKLQQQFAQQLRILLKKAHPYAGGGRSDWDLIAASLPQLKEAFLRTLGLWTEAPTQPQ